MHAPSRAGWVVALHEADGRVEGSVGTKAATLARLVRAGLAVPEGLVLTAAACDAVREHAGLADEARAEQLLTAQLPADVEAALAAIAAHFGDATLAVRSSAVEEDGPEASYAGQFETVLHVRGLDALREAVRRCWASAYSAQVRAYRPGHGSSSIGVLVQRQVAADVAGVAFTADPVTGSRDEVLVSAVPGLGDALVSGAVQPDEWSVRDSTARPVRVSHQALAEAQAQVIAALALRVQQVLGGPQDIEWAMAGGRLVVLQARPITALPQAPEVDLPEGTTWLKESERHPEPLTKLGASFAAPVVSQGLTTMSAAAGGLIERFEMRIIGGEPYLRVVPVGGHAGPPPPWWVFGILTRVVPALRRRMATAKRLLSSGELDGLLQRWQHEWRPHFQAEFGRLQAVQLPALDDAALTAHLDDVLATAKHALAVHFQLTPPVLIGVHGLIATCAELLDWPDQKSLELLAGTSPATSGPADALADLGAEIRAHPAARAAVESTGADGADLAGRLRAADASLGAAFELWCERYGYRCTNDDPGSPTLVEMPWLLAGLLREAVQGSADARRSALAARREARADEARRQLTGRSAELARFESALGAAQRAYPVREDSAFWTGSMPGGMLRITAMEVGRRLAARDQIDRAEDVVHVDLDTLRSAIAPDEPTPTLRPGIARAKAERAWVRAHPGPAFYGPPPPPFPDLRALPGPGRRVNEAMLWTQRRAAARPRPESTAAGTLAGLPAAPGRYTGPVRVITRTTEFGRLRPGDVLVCPTTDPAWSVLFGTAGALVADGGGPLSHAAIVAREYAIPAVVGTGTGTSTLHDGQVVTVDGTAGVVVIDPAASPSEGDQR